jgi:hypothetical protein
MDVVYGCGRRFSYDGWRRDVEYNGSVYKWDGDAIIGFVCRSSLVIPGTSMK